MRLDPDVERSRQLRAFLYASLLKIGGVDATKLQAVLKHEFRPAYPEPANRRSDDSADHGFFGDGSALWMRRSYIQHATENGQTFDNENARGVKHRETIRKDTDEWLDGHVDVISELDEDDREWIEETICIAAKSVPRLGMPVIGTHEGIVWMAATHDRTILNEPDARRRALLISKTIQPFPIETQLSWTELIPTEWSLQHLARTDPQRFATIARNVLSEVLDSSIATTASRRISTVGAVTGTFDIIITDSTPQRVPEMLRAALREQPIDADWVALASSADYEVTAEALKAILIERKIPARFLIADPNAIQALVGTRPWIWTESVTPPTLAVCRAGGTAVPACHHPRLPQNVGVLENTLITGGPGTGKSNALRSCIHTPPLEQRVVEHGVEVLVSGGEGPVPAQLVSALVDDFARRGYRLNVGIDDADKLPNDALLLALAGIQKKAPHLRLVMAASHRSVVIEAFIRATRAMYDVALNCPPREFLLDVARHAARTHRVDADTLELLKLVEFLVQDGSGTPAHVVDEVRRASGRRLFARESRRGFVDPIARVRAWQRGDVDGRLRYQLLQCVAVLNDLGIPHLHRKAIIACVKGVTHQAIERVEQCWNDIEETRSALAQESEVFTDTPPLPPWQFGLWERSDPFPWRARLWFERHLDWFTDAGRRAILFFLCMHYGEFAPGPHLERLRRRFRSYFPYDDLLDGVRTALANREGIPPPPEFFVRAAERAAAPPYVLLDGYFQRGEYAEIGHILKSWIGRRPEWFVPILQMLAENKGERLIPTLIAEFLQYSRLPRELADLLFSLLLTLAISTSDDAVVSQALRVIREGTGAELVAAADVFESKWRSTEFQEALVKVRLLFAASGIDVEQIWKTPEGMIVKSLMHDLRKALFIQPK